MMNIVIANGVKIAQGQGNVNKDVGFGQAHLAMPFFCHKGNIWFLRGWGVRLRYLGRGVESQNFIDRKAALGKMESTF